MDTPTFGYVVSPSGHVALALPPSCAPDVPSHVCRDCCGHLSTSGDGDVDVCDGCGYRSRLVPDADGPVTMFEGGRALTFREVPA